MPCFVGPILAHFLITQPPTAAQKCPVCSLPLFPPPDVAFGFVSSDSKSSDLVVLFLCRHMVHAHCIRGAESLPRRGDDSDVVVSLLRGSDAKGGQMRREKISQKIA